ncbi:MAG: DNA recombination protein RmuC [Legionellales bacterium]|nr:DNA recombination protein RmuC [Legionellales bacterium]
MFFFNVITLIGWGIAAYLKHRLTVKDQELKSLKDWKHTQLNEHNKIHQLQHQYLSTQNTQHLHLQDHLTRAMQDIRTQLESTLRQHAESFNHPLKTLTDTVEKRLENISTQVNGRLEAGFEKTNAIFTSVIQRLAQIDEAQKRIQNLSETLCDFKHLLNDKKARGTFGEVQLATLVRNTLPEQHFQLQYTLSNGKRADCMLFLPQPTGHMAIDSKFPLESYQKMMNASDESTQKQHQKQFSTDLITHIEHIAQRYIIPNETAPGAIMFIPAESIFADIHSSHPNVIAKAHALKVWLVSPSTMMAILTTALGILKDIATQKQVHDIQKHLGHLNQDFKRFKKRMDNLSRHIQQAHDDIQQVHTSSHKISTRFEQIEAVQLETHSIEVATPESE